CQQHDSDPFTF
nr:immunoglobulin light chain junction region [Macaca mulatta]